MPKETCRDCNRTVVLVRVGDNLVATDPELISVVRATSSPNARGSGPRGPLRMAASPDIARRVHAERCEDYQNEDRRARLAAEMREFTKKQERAKARRKNHGL